MNDRRLLKKLYERYGESENYYILQLKLSRAVKNRKSVTNRLKNTLEKALISHKLRLPEEEITNCILYESRRQPFCEEEILSVDAAVCLALLTLLTSEKEMPK